MKKIYLLLYMAFFAIISMAQISPSKKAIPASRYLFHRADNIVLQQQNKAVDMLNLPSDNPMTEQPKGVNYTNVNRSGRGYYSSVLGVDFGEYTCTLGEYVMGDDNNVYIKNPFSQKKTNSYLKLERLSGDTLIARLPQTIGLDEGHKTFVTRMVLKIFEDDKYTYTPDTLSDNTIASDMKFVMRNDSIIQLSEGRNEEYNHPKTILGEMSSEGYWTGFGDDEQVWSLINDPMTALPENAVATTYQMSYLPTDSTTVSKTVRVAFDGNNVYINTPDNTEEWIKGVITGNKAVFKLQYLGRNEAENCHVYFIPATFTLVNHFSNYKDADELIFEYNAEEKSLKSAKGTSLFVSAGKILSENNKLFAYDEPQFVKFVEKPATPAAPEIRSATSNVTGWGGSIEYVIKVEDTEGNYISEDKLFYRVYFDNETEPFVFIDADGEQMTEIPYNYTDGFSFFNIKGVRYIVSLMKEFNRVGIEEIYKGGGETRVSETTWYDVVSDEIRNVDNNENVKSITYYTLSGKQINKPANGLFIQVTTYADGSKKSMKIIR